MKGHIVMDELNGRQKALLALAAVAIAVGIIVALFVGSASTVGEVRWQEQEYIVQTDDTLWGIGSAYCPENVDIREWIDEVQEINGLSDSCIHAGDKLVIIVPQG